MRFCVAVKSDAADRRSGEAKRVLDDFVKRSGVTVVGDADPVATLVESSRSLEELAALGGDSMTVENLVKFRPGI